MGGWLAMVRWLGGWSDAWVGGWVSVWLVCWWAGWLGAVELVSGRVGGFMFSLVGQCVGPWWDSWVNVEFCVWVYGPMFAGQGIYGSLKLWTFEFMDLRIYGHRICGPSNLWTSNLWVMSP